MHLRRLAAPLAVLVVSACSSSGPRPGLGDPYPPPLNDPQITILSPNMQQWIRFSPARVEQYPDRPMYVEVPARNTTENHYVIDYRFSFYNERDIELEPTMTWMQETLQPKQTVRLKGNALSTDATRYRLEVRWGR